MTFGICSLSVIPVRSSASERGEQVSQMLFGEVFEVLERKGRKWMKVRCQMDNYVGWLVSHQVKAITPSEFQTYSRHFAYNLEVVQAVSSVDHFLPITLGARLPRFDGLRFHMGETAYHFSGQAVFPENIKVTADFILKIARRYIQAPYLWGGRSPFGIDSAGLVQMVFQMGGHLLPRSAEQQVHLGESVDFEAQARPGDIAFFEDRKGRIAHVGIIMPEHQIIHAHGRVRIDRLDHFGIYDESRSRYTYRLRVIKRILPLEEIPSARHRSDAETASRQAELF